jgi:hypothetical protein
MRSRLGGLLAFGAALLCAASACSTAGVSFIYMAIDSAGKQPRKTFYTDTTSIYAIVDFSAARPDATLDLVVHQTGVYSWCNSGSLDTNPDHLHPNFAEAEIVPGVGTETVVAAELPPTGYPVSQDCPTPDKCIANTSSLSLCSGGVAAQPITCPGGYESAGNDSCAPGYQCCLAPISVIDSATSSGSTDQVASIPYPAGQYTMDVFLDGVNVGSAAFEIQYPPGNCPVANVVSGVPCYNWSPLGTQCAGYEGGQNCTCADTGVWDCH